jgi:hypothetical protein
MCCPMPHFASLQRQQAYAMSVKEDARKAMATVRPMEQN